MKKSAVILTRYSPLMAVDTKLVDNQGQLVETPRVYSLCRCGGSKKKPLCDGSHAENGFRG